ncbi:MAG: glycogen debranching enzyme family protein [Acidobacteria bacterium]|nr:glycogen debranching enzyme family protein [Acidobacteriota bacterium]
MINFDSEICTDFARSSWREWLETNGIGGFASGTISGANTRRYHSLLTAATAPPLGRLTMLSKFEETLFVGGAPVEFSANQYLDRIYPEGYKYLTSFRLAPFPVWTFKIETVEIEKKIFMAHGENTTIVEYKIKNQDADLKIELELKPLLSFCDYHALQHETADFDANYETAENLVTVKPYAHLPPLYFAHNSQTIEKTAFWYRNFEYAIERERGFDSREDLFQPFSLKFDLSKGSAIVIASTMQKSIADARKFEDNEIERRENLIKTANAEDDFTKQLALAADQFIVSRGNGKTIIAGYPWFSDWGRDTMIALNGLTLATNRAEIARDILLEFSRHISEGMLPNRFPDAGEQPEYNTVDATLWFFEAVRAYVAKTDDYDFVEKNLYEKLVDIIDWHVGGTRFQIKVDAASGLLYAGEAGVQLTWMDAKIGDFVVTPRTGFAVEIQALWYNALVITADFAEKFGDKIGCKKYRRAAEKAKKSFNEIFWNDAEQCLFDVINGAEKDASVRPNQIFAASLPHRILDFDKARKVVAKVEAELLTPYGLRSLSPKDKNYRPVYIGSPFERDSVYHQGTVWAWLTGAFVDAYRKVYANEANIENRVAEILSGFKTHLNTAGVGQISEIFDADAPHKSRGCFAQAWSVAEVLRVSSGKL